MSKREIASLACKILALSVVVQGIIRLGSMVTTLVARSIRGPGDWSVTVYGVCSSGFMGMLLLLLAWLIWAKSERLAVRMVGAEETPESGRSISQEEWINIAAGAVGILLLAVGVRSLVRSVVWSCVAVGSGARTTIDTPGIVAAVVEIALGGWLVVGSKRMVRRIWRLRTMGRKGTSE